jgi:hypothetical protein
LNIWQSGDSRSGWAIFPVGLGQRACDQNDHDEDQEGGKYERHDLFERLEKAIKCGNTKSYYYE